MPLLTCLQQCTVFACPVGNGEASKHRKAKDEDVSGGVHICVLHREMVQVMFGTTRTYVVLFRRHPCMQEGTQAAALVLLGW